MCSEMAYNVKHLGTESTFERPAILINDPAKQRTWEQHIEPAVEAFHRTLPSYGETQLHSLPEVAFELG
jgi:diaminopropionate ammonia-lyase